jgi:hypothetical protein
MGEREMVADCSEAGVLLAPRKVCDRIVAEAEAVLEASEESDERIGSCCNFGNDDTTGRAADLHGKFQLYPSSKILVPGQGWVGSNPKARLVPMRSSKRWC